MTGWRIGWMIAPPDVMDAAVNYQSQTTSNISNISQRAAVAALTGDLVGGRRDARGLRPAPARR